MKISTKKIYQSTPMRETADEGTDQNDFPRENEASETMRDYDKMESYYAPRAQPKAEYGAPPGYYGRDEHSYGYGPGSGYEQPYYETAGAPYYDNGLYSEPKYGYSGMYYANEGAPRLGQELKRKAKQRICANCSATNTPSWRRGGDGKMLLCNACGLYQKLHNRPRPFSVTAEGKTKALKGSYDKMVCVACNHLFPAAEMKVSGDGTMCETCAVYFKNQASIGRKSSEQSQPEPSGHDKSPKHEVEAGEDFNGGRKFTNYSSYQSPRSYVSPVGYPSPHSYSSTGGYSSPPSFQHSQGYVGSPGYSGPRQFAYPRHNYDNTDSKFPAERYHPKYVGGPYDSKYSHADSYGTEKKDVGYPPSSYTGKYAGDAYFSGAKPNNENYAMPLAGRGSYYGTSYTDYEQYGPDSYRYQSPRQQPRNSYYGQSSECHQKKNGNFYSGDFEYDQKSSSTGDSVPSNSVNTQQTYKNNSRSEGADNNEL